MTLEDAIKHCEYVADSDCYGASQMACAEEHRQLAEWLRELKAYKNKYHKYYKPRRASNE